MGTHAPPCRAARGGAARGPTLKRRPLAFHSVLFSPFSQFGPHFAPTTSFAHILRSGTPIDDPSSPTRYTRLRLTIRLRLRTSGQGSGSGGHRQSDCLVKGKAVAYAPESSPDTDEEYDAMEDVRTRVNSAIARNLQAKLDAEAASIAASAARPTPGPGITIGGSARSSGASRQPTRTPMGAPPRRSSSKRQRADRDPPESVGRGWWSDFGKLLDVARREYREFLTELGFDPFLSIPYVYMYHPLARCWLERFFHHTGTFHLSTCEMGVLPVDWSAILGIRFGGRVPLSEPVSGAEALDILGIDNPDAIEGARTPSLRIHYLRDLLRRERDELPTELRYLPTPIDGMFRDVDALWEYDWGALTYGFFIRGLRRFSCQEMISFLGFWRWDAAQIRKLTSRSGFDHPRSWELFMGERTVRQLGGEAVVPVDPPPLMTIEGYILDTPSDSYMVGVDYHPDLVRAEVPYQEWFEQNSLGPLMSLHEVEGGHVMGGMAMDSHQFREIASRDAELAARDASIWRLEDQLTSLGIGPLTRASSSGHGQTSSPPPPDPVSRDWFFDDPPPS
uniref:Aminotransferase-like plant mobile domain-containing protein n=1 Tax=Fagus sylvatica TaxID=28930 RepID=A0A2N9EEA6_FAGSY